MDADELYDLVTDAVRQGLEEHAGGGRVRLSKRLLEGRILIEDGEGRPVKELPVDALFKKITGVREKLRVMEQKINNTPSLDAAERAELQGYITRCYGSLTTFNVLFQDDADRFQGTGKG